MLALPERYQVKLLSYATNTRELTEKSVLNNYNFFIKYERVYRAEYCKRAHINSLNVLEVCLIKHSIAGAREVPHYSYHNIIILQ